MSTCPDCETGRNLLAGACRSVFRRGLTGGSAGNMSLRVEGGILATPTGIPFGELTPESLSLLDETGALVSGGRGSPGSRSDRQETATAHGECRCTTAR